ncbi:MAG: MFS transporter [Candidatus Eisenbacteria bacterium]
MNTRALSVGVIYTTALLQGATFVSLPALSRVLTAQFGISETLYGSLYLPMVGVGAVTSLLGTTALRTFGLQPLFTMGLAANATALFGFAILARIPQALCYPALVATAIVLGLSLGLMGIALNTGAMRLFPRQRARALAQLHAAIGIGAAGGPQLFSYWYERGFWQAEPILLLIATLALLAISSRRRIEGLQHTGTGGGHWRHIPTRVWSRGMTTFLYGVSESTLAAWAILFLTQHRDASDLEAARALSAFWLCMTFGRLGGTLILRRTGAIPLVLALLCGMGVAFPLVTLAGRGSSAIVAYGLAGLACSAVFPILMGLASEEAPDHLPQLSAILSACLLAGLGLGSFWVGPLSAEVPMEWVLRFSAIWPALLIGTVLALRLRPNAKMAAEES